MVCSLWTTGGGYPTILNSIGMLLYKSKSRISDILMIVLHFLFDVEGLQGVFREFAEAIVPDDFL